MPPLALAVIGPKNDRYAGAEMVIPVLKRGPRATKAVAGHADGALRQLGKKEVTRRRDTLRATLDPSQHVAWIRASCSFFLWGSRKRTSKRGKPL